MNKENCELKLVGEIIHGISFVKTFVGYFKLYTVHILLYL